MIYDMHDFSTHFPPIPTRSHEVCGPSALSFAFALGGTLGGKVLWVREAWLGDTINPVSFADYLDPNQVLIAQAPSHIDALAVAEEALRSGDIALVVMELSQPIGLTEGRRLQLAAQAGRSTGLCILPEGMGSNAAQTRWHCAPVFDEHNTSEDSTLQLWKLTKNKSGTLSAWTVEWHAQTRRINVVSKTAQR
jgi:protein ImuA